MQFKDIKSNYPIYILNKKDMTLSQGKVLSVSLPHMDQTNLTSTQMIIDVRVECDGHQANYMIPEHAVNAYSGNLVLAGDSKDLTPEIEAIRNEAEQIIASYDHYKEVASKAKDLLAEVNPQMKKEQEYNKRLSQMEEKFESLLSKLDQVIENKTN